MRDKCEELVYAARRAGLTVHAVFAHGRRRFDWPALAADPRWPSAPSTRPGRRSTYFRLSGIYGTIGRAELRGFDKLWVRGMPTTPAQLLLFRRARGSGVETLVDLPTFPYGYEQASGIRALLYRLSVRLDALRARYLDAVATTSEHRAIWRKPTLRVSNGVDLSRAAPAQRAPCAHAITAVGIAQWAPVHGLDRLFRSVHAASLGAKFHFVLAGVGPLNAQLAALGESLGLSVEWVGPVHGPQRSELLGRATIAIGGLSFPGNRLTHHYSLKHRLYAAAGVPFVATFRDPLWVGCSAVYTVDSDDEPIDGHSIYVFAQAAIERRREFSLSLRRSVEGASWDVTYAPVWDWLSGT